MNKIILFLIATTFLFSCDIENRKPEFKRVENVNVKSLSATLTEVTADVVVYNPNGVSVFLNSTEIDVFANDLKITHISQTENTEITKKSEFKIPIKANMNLMDLIKDEASVLNIINSSLSGFKDKKVDLNFTGTAQFKVAGISFDVPIDYQEVVELKK